MRILICLLLGISVIISCKTSNKSKNEANTNANSPISLCGPTKADLNTPPGNDGNLSPLYEGLDVYHFPVSTKSEKA